MKALARSFALSIADPRLRGDAVVADDGLPRAGFVRIDEIVRPRGPLPISRSTWWAGVKTGRYPAPVKLGRRVTAWRVADVRALFTAAAGQRDMPS
jgi:prophage regulatory protein